MSAAIHASWNFVTKKASGSLGTICIGLCFASLVTLPFALYFIFLDGVPLYAVPYIAATGIIHAFYFYYIGKSYEFGDISIVYPIARGIGVAGTGIVAATVLNETISLPGFTGIALVVSGTLIIGSYRAHDGTAGKSVLYALMVGLTIIGYSCLDKVGVGYSNPVPYICGMFTISAVILTLFAIVRHRDDIANSWKRKKTYSMAIGTGSIATYLLILFAFRQGPASYIVAVRELSVVIGSLLGFILLHERFTVRKLIGITAITAGLILIKIA
jgi:uncharacterized membrane protein